MNKHEIVQQTLRAKDFFDVVGQVDKKIIPTIENELNVILPESYKWFLETYGHGGIGGVEIYGVISSTDIPVIERTKDYRESGLPVSYVVIQSLGEWVYCLDTSGMENLECPVIEWDRELGTGNKQYNNFYHFLHEKFQQELESLSEDGLI